MYCDILYGSQTSIKGYRYALFIVDRATRFKFVYSLRNLTSVLPAFKKFYANVGYVPKELRTDFDKMLMGHTMQKIMTDNHSTIFYTSGETAVKWTL